MRDACNILVGKTEGNRPLGKAMRRRENNIRMDLTEIGLEIMDWNHLAQDRE
jgi:chorismate-pyruvate lyase